MRETRVDKIPAGWESLYDIAKIEGKTPETCRRPLNEAVRAGLIKGKLFKVRVGGQVRGVKYYKFPK